MPYTNVSGTAAVVVSYPPPYGHPHSILFNIGAQNAYVGQSGVSSATGLVVAPGGRVDLANASGTIYGIGGFNQTTPYGTANAATSYPSGSTITVASGGTAFASATTIVVEPGTPRQEIATVFSSNAGSVVTNAPFTFAHGSATTFSAITPLLTTVKAERGTS